jgi:hypothetical protein
MGEIGNKRMQHFTFCARPMQADFFGNLPFHGIKHAEIIIGRPE